MAAVWNKRHSALTGVKEKPWWAHRIGDGERGVRITGGLSALSTAVVFAGIWCKPAAAVCAWRMFALGAIAHYPSCQLQARGAPSFILVLSRYPYLLVSVADREAAVLNSA